MSTERDPNPGDYGTCPTLCVQRSHFGREHDEATDGCTCWQLCEMGPTCPGANAGLDRGCWRTDAEGAEG